MKKNAFILIIITLISGVFGFAREITLSYYYGASELTDVYLIALTIPSTLFAFFGTALATGYIPMYSKIATEEGRESANQFTSNLLHIILVISALLIAVVMMFTPQVVKVCASGFTGETLRLAVLFTRVSMVSIIFSGTMYILTGYLQIKNMFIVPALIGFPLNMTVIGAIIISSKQTNIMVLIWGTVAASLLQLLCILPSVYLAGYRHRVVFSPKDEQIRTMLILALPVLLGTSVNQLNILVDRTLASSIAVGGISALNYASRLQGFVQGIFVSSIASVIYPSISRMATEGRLEELKHVVGKSVNTILLVVLPASVGAMAFAKPIVRLLFGQGAFDYRAINMTAGALFFFAIGMAAIGLREVLSKAFYSLHDTKTPMYNAALSVVLNIIMSLVLSRFMGISGLALSTSISAIFCSGLLFWSLRKKIGALGLKTTARSTLKIFIASVVMAVGAVGAYNFLKDILGGNVGLLIAIAVGALVYVILVVMLRIPEVEEILGVNP